VTYKEGDKEFRECVSCGFLDEMRFQQNQREVETRVNVSSEQEKVETQVLMLDPKGSVKQH
jgi:Zn ribbon nucleic-acid-binding protein